MPTQEPKDVLSDIVAALEAAGYDPLAQLTGYLKSSDLTYITRRENAREKIQQLDKSVILAYVSRLTPNTN